MSSVRTGTSSGFRARPFKAWLRFVWSDKPALHKARRKSHKGYPRCASPQNYRTREEKILGSGYVSAPARGDDVVHLQEEEVVEVVVDEERREHHRVEREVVLLGEVPAEGPERHVGAEDERVG